MEKEVIQSKSEIPKFFVESEEVHFKDVDTYVEMFIRKRQKIRPESFKLYSVSVCNLPNRKEDTHVLVTIAYSI